MHGDANANPEGVNATVNTPQTDSSNQSDSGQNQSLFTLISQLVNQFQQLIRDEIALAKLKLSQAMQKMGAGIALLAVAGLFSLLLLFWIFHAIEAALLLAVPAWAAALITAGILLILIVIFLLGGIMLIKKGSEDMPDVGAGIKADVEVLKEGLEK